MIYGSPSLHVDLDTTDRIGIRTVALSRMWQPSRWSDDDISPLTEEAPAAPIVSGGMLLVGSSTRPAGGALRTSWTYEGINGDGKSVTFKDRTTSLDYRFDPSFAQVDIAKHPRLQLFKDQYGAYPQDGEIFFPPDLPSGTASAGVSGARGGDGKSKSNPLFGTKDFLRMEGTYSFRYASLSEPSDGSTYGNIYTTGLPGRPPKFSKRNWLKQPTKWQRRGLVFEVVEEYWLSGEGGWPEEIYGKGPSSNPGSGVQGSGGLGDTGFAGGDPFTT